MLEKTFKLETADGLHARPAGLLVKCLTPFQSKVEIELRGQKKNAKSIMSLMSLGAANGDEIKLIFNGTDADAAAAAVEALFARGFVLE